MTYFEATVLGLVQGLAEFLPISSSGHLALLQNWFGIDETKVLLFTVLLHVGTLISVFIMYWKDIWELIVELVLTIKDLCTGKGLRMEERLDKKTRSYDYSCNNPYGNYRIIVQRFLRFALHIRNSNRRRTDHYGFLLVFAEKKGESDRGIKQMNLRKRFSLELCRELRFAREYQDRVPRCLEALSAI